MITEKKHLSEYLIQSFFAKTALWHHLQYIQNTTLNFLTLTLSCKPPVLAFMII